MFTIHEIEQEIEEIKNGKMTWDSVMKLAHLCIVKEHLEENNRLESINRKNKYPSEETFNENKITEKTSEYVRSADVIEGYTNKMSKGQLGDLFCFATKRLKNMSPHEYDKIIEYAKILTE